MKHGKYTFVREIGRGASGTVWLARDTVLGRDVAIKQVGHAPDGGEAERERADREARLAASLTHPHVVAVHDLFEENGAYWLVMEYVDGHSLAELVRRSGPLPPERAARLLTQVADALAAAHRAGFVHRDVKPSNILVAPGDHALLTDFGIARAFEDASLTRTGLVTGSPAYLSPEVAQGRPATPASDVWALGATLYHVLAGHPPYEVADNLLATMYRIVHEEPPRLDIAGRLASVLEHTMAVNPADRWATERVRDALEGTATTERTAVSPAVAPRRTQVSGPRTRRPLHAVRWLVAGALVVAASILAFSLGAQNGRPDPDGPTAAPNTVATTSPTPTQETEDVTRDEMVDFVTDYLQTVTDAPRVSWERLTPDFQRASNGFGAYRAFWSTVADAELLSITADPDTMTVSYTVRYTLRDGERRRDDVQLRLVEGEQGLLIDGEA